MTRRRTTNGQELRLVTAPDVSGRPPPHDLDAEAATLSAAILDATPHDDGTGCALTRVLDILKPEHFYSEANARIYQAVQELAIASTPIDLVSIASWLRDRKWLEKMGGTAYLAQIIDATPALGHVTTHAAIVFEKWRLRQMIATCQVIAAEGYGDVGTVQEFLSGADASVAAIARGGATENLDRFAIGEIASESAARAIAIHNAPGAFITTGIDAVDAVTGLYQNEVTLLGAPKGLGKTTLARFIANRMARTPRRNAECDACERDRQPCSPEHRYPRGVLAFALEGSREDWSDYSAASTAGLNLFDQRNGRWRTDETATFLRELEGLKRVPILVDDRKDLNRANIGARVRAARDWFAKRGAVLEKVVLDYFQIAPWERGGDSRENDLNDAGRHIIRLATDGESDLRGLSWLVISALNKDGGTRESGALEYHCDTFWRLSAGRERDARDGLKSLRLWVEKQRRGPSQVGCSFWFDQAAGKFW